MSPQQVLELTITGNTYPYRAIIRSWGDARWDAASKAWHVTVIDCAAYKRAAKSADLVIHEVERAPTAAEEAQHQAAMADREVRAKRAKAGADAFDWADFASENEDLYEKCQRVELDDPHRAKERIWRKLKSGRDALSRITDACVLAELASRHRAISCGGERDPHVLRWVLRGLSYWGAAHKAELDAAERAGRSIAAEKGLSDT